MSDGGVQRSGQVQLKSSSSEGKKNENNPTQLIRRRRFSVSGLVDNGQKTQSSSSSACAYTAAQTEPTPVKAQNYSVTRRPKIRKLSGLFHDVSEQQQQQKKHSDWRNNISPLVTLKCCGESIQSIMIAVNEWICKLPERDQHSPKSLRIPPGTFDIGIVTKISPEGMAKVDIAFTYYGENGNDSKDRSDLVTSRQRRVLLCAKTRDPRIVDIFGIVDHDTGEGGGGCEVVFSIEKISKTFYEKDISEEVLCYRLLEPWIIPSSGFDRCGTRSVSLACSRFIDSLRHTLGVLGESDALSSGMVGRGISSVSSERCVVDEIARAFSAQAWTDGGIGPALAFSDVALPAAAAWEGGKAWDRYCWIDTIMKDSVAFSIHFSDCHSALEAIRDDINRRWIGSDPKVYCVVMTPTTPRKRVWCEWETGTFVQYGSVLHCMLESSTEGSLIRSAEPLRPCIAFLVRASVAVLRSMTPCMSCPSTRICQHIQLPTYHGKTVVTAKDLASVRWVSARTEFQRNAGMACHAMGGCGFSPYAKISKGGPSSNSTEQHEELVAKDMKRFMALSQWKRTCIEQKISNNSGGCSGTTTTMVSLDRVSKRMKASQSAELSLVAWSKKVLCIGMVETIPCDFERYRISERLSDTWYPLSLAYTVSPWKGTGRDGVHLVNIDEAGAWRSAASRVQGIPGYTELRESNWDIESIAQYCPPCITRIINVCKTERHPAYKERMHIGCLLVSIDGLSDDTNDGLYKTWKTGLFSHPENATIPDANTNRFDRSKYGRDAVKRIRIFTMEKGKRFGCNSAIEDLVCPFSENAKKEANQEKNKLIALSSASSQLPLLQQKTTIDGGTTTSEDTIVKSVKSICLRMCAEQLSKETGRDFSRARISYPADFYARKYAALNSSKQKNSPKKREVFVVK